jgi:hypothetical protein
MGTRFRFLRLPGVETPGTVNGRNISLSLITRTDSCELNRKKLEFECSGLLTASTACPFVNLMS